MGAGRGKIEARRVKTKATAGTDPLAVPSDEVAETAERRLRAS